MIDKTTTTKQDDNIANTVAKVHLHRSTFSSFIGENIEARGGDASDDVIACSCEARLLGSHLEMHTIITQLLYHQTLHGFGVSLDSTTIIIII